MKRNVFQFFVGLQVLASAASAALPPAAVANNHFGLKAFQTLGREKATENQFFSPVSAYLALSMVAHGARGATSQELAALLGQDSRTDWVKANGALMTSLRATRSGSLEIANGLWAHPDLKLNPQYLSSMERTYGAALASADLGLQSSIDSINAWVKNKTHDRIESILDQPNPALVAFLANATYFEAKWTKKFTRTDWKLPFTTEDGAKEEVAVLTDDRMVRYAEGESYSAIELSYGEDQGMSMILALPTKGTMGEFVAKLTDKSLNGLIESVMKANPSLTNVAVPKFKIEITSPMTQALKDLGAVSLFSEQADLSGIAQGMMVSNVLQKTFIKVYEEGTIAAAVTGIGFSIASVPPTPTYSFVADRPFFYLLRENKTGTILFVGTVMKPIGGDTE